MNRKAIGCSLGALALLCTGGCVHESAEGATHTFTYEWWVPISILLGGLIATPAGWALKGASARFGWALLVGGPLAALFFAPSMFLDRAVVNDNSFSLRSGVWGMTAVHDVNLDDVRQIRFTMEETTGRRGRKKQNYYLVCDRNDGSSAKIPIGNKLAEAAAPLFIEQATKRGIPVIDQT